MAINLKQLQDAAERFDEYQGALAKAKTMPDIVLAEQAKVSQDHRTKFRLLAERLLGQPQPETVTKTVEAVVVLAEAPQPGAPPQLEGGLLVVTDSGIIPEIVQRDNDLRPMRFLHIAVLAARAVGRIKIVDSPVTQEGDATGFLVAPGLMMTNWHVLKNEDIAAAASIIFDDEEGVDGNPLETKSFRLRPDILFVNDETLDYAIVAVSPRTASDVPLSQFGFLRLFPQRGKLDPLQRQTANIIQHPGGGPKKIALRDNYVREVVPDFVDPNKSEISLFYGTDTLKGSSGSPVCSDQWYVVALHRGGVPITAMINGQRVVLRHNGTPASQSDPKDMLKYETNEGTRISRIYKSLQDKAETSLHAAAALEQISAVATDPRMGPISLRTTPILLPSLPPEEMGGLEEIMRRKQDKFEGAAGYVPTFLGSNHSIDLPRMTSEIKRELAPLKNSTDTELKYANYSLVMNRERRTAFFIAGNIEGSQMWKTQGLGGLPKRPQWSFDPRMDDVFQPDDTIFSNAMQRGHLFKREDAVWGVDADAMKLADEHSFRSRTRRP